MSDSDKRQPKPAQPPKRPYRKPRLEVYGGLAKITAAVGHKSGNNDGATGKVTDTK
jgi:hypothetical protein